MSVPLLLNAASVVDSKHNLAVSGPGDVKAAVETEVCLFCHTPHQSTGEVPLWNHTMSVQTYTPYSSTTLKATDVGQPTGASKLCLSCHDGTVALGMVGSRSTPITMRNSTTVMPAGGGFVGTDLSGEHPISFRYDSALATADTQLKDPSALSPRVRLDNNSQMQCTSCHDPHDNQFGMFLVEDNVGSSLCNECHVMSGWTASIHKTSTATWNGRGINPWAPDAQSATSKRLNLSSGKAAPAVKQKTVAANGCQSCHAPHNAGTKPRLLKSAVTEQNCLICHNGNVAAKNIQTEFEKFSVHPIATTGALHDQAERTVNPPRHVTCVDCHNPHAAKQSSAGSAHAPQSLFGAKGVNSLGAIVNNVSKESDLCYRCHGDSVGRGPSVLNRQFSDTNKRLQFSASSASFHPVETIGKNRNVPSLISPWTSSSLMTCSDCHNNNDGPSAGGKGPRGPHGSSFPPLLERQLVMIDRQPENDANYALCYKCHSRPSILNDQSFRFHKLHVVDQQAACTTCHSAHGVQLQAKLINFNTTYAAPSSNGKFEFISTGTYSGTCSVTCHGRDHNAVSYSPLGVAQPAGLRKQKAPLRRR